MVTKKLIAAVYGLLITLSPTHAANIKPINAAIHAGEQFLSGQVTSDHYSLACQSNTKNPCPLNGIGRILPGFYIIQALGPNHRVPEIIRNKIIGAVEKEKRSLNKEGDLWGYTSITPLDSDDTSYALQTLLYFDKKIDISGLQYFYIPSQHAYVTLIPGYQLRHPVKPVTQVTLENTYHIHAEVNANIFALFQELHMNSRINYPLIKQFQTADGYWHHFFYPGKYYATYMSMKLLCKAEKNSQEVDKGIKFILAAQNANGSWGKPANAYETSLALNTLLSCEQKTSAIQHGIDYLLLTQNKKGYWQSNQIIWEYIYKGLPYELWQSYDNNHVITTSLAVLALKNYKNR